ncbi:MAG: radical SAM protein [Desulfobacterales bacterium]|jgi:hypothetical protein
MKHYRLKNLDIILEREGANRYTKASYPIRYGRYSEIETRDYLFQFNLNGDIKYIRGLNQDWPHPAEWLKRTEANDWAYYTAGGYRGIFHTLGEYYLPCLSYPSNSVYGYNPFADENIQKAFKAWIRLLENLRRMRTNGIPSKVKNFLFHISGRNPCALRIRSEKLHRIIGGQVSVLPPDTRHVDYGVIPLMLTDGCRYHCGFCCIKTRQNFHPRSRGNVRQQIRQLRAFYGADLANHNAIFLGNHDALAAGHEHICMAAAEAYAAFDFDKAYVKDPALFLFGSVDSLLDAGDDLFETLNRLPFYTYINVGLESVDAATLKSIQKPLEISKIEDAFQLMLAVNRSYPNLEITANFLLGDHLSARHYQALVKLIRNRLDRYYSKGAIYLSPLNTSHDNRKLLNKFVEIKNLSRLPTYLYLIQRL